MPRIKKASLAESMIADFTKRTNICNCITAAVKSLINDVFIDHTKLVDNYYGNQIIYG